MDDNEPTQDPPEGGSSDSPVTYRWLGDESRWFDGVPNRDITEADTYLDPELLQAAVDAGTHQKVS